MADEFTPWERDTLEHVLTVGREIADTAVTLRANYVSAHLRIGDGELVGFAYEDGAVWAHGVGFEVELSGLPGW
jgi:hypothetical protein